jgi:hypothetical protein
MKHCPLPSEFVLAGLAEISACKIDFLERRG